MPLQPVPSQALNSEIMLYLGASVEEFQQIEQELALEESQNKGLVEQVDQVTRIELIFQRISEAKLALLEAVVQAAREQVEKERTFSLETVKIQQQLPADLSMMRQKRVQEQIDHFNEQFAKAKEAIDQNVSATKADLACQEMEALQKIAQEQAEDRQQHATAQTQISALIAQSAQEARANILAQHAAERPQRVSSVMNQVMSQFKQLCDQYKGQDYLESGRGAGEINRGFKEVWGTVGAIANRF